MSRVILSIVVVLVLAHPLRSQDRFTILSTVTVAATAYDIETTLNAFKRCPTCSEANPFMKVFMERRGTAYTAGMGLTGTALWSGYQLRKQGKRWWWVPMVGAVGLHVGSAIHNQKVR
jgi:hypothetical protein